MASITFDTLEFVKTLRDAGVDNRQAEAIATAVRDGIASRDLATKQDLREALAETETRITKWVLTVGILQTSIITALLLKLIH